MPVKSCYHGSACVVQLARAMVFRSICEGRTCILLGVLEKFKSKPRPGYVCPSK